MGAVRCRHCAITTMRILPPLFGLLLAAVAPSFFITSAKGEQLWRDPVNYSPLYGQSSYNTGSYSELRDDDINRSTLYDSTIRDNRTGDLYDCGSLGVCHRR